MFYLLPAQERAGGGNGARVSHLDIAQAVHPYVEHVDPGVVTDERRFPTSPDHLASPVRRVEWQ